MSAIDSYPNVFDSKNPKWINCEFKFETTTGEKLIGKLQGLDPKSNVFTFVDLRNDDGKDTPRYLTQNYSYRDFRGNLICITKNVSIDFDAFKAQEAERSLLLQLDDKNETLVHIENSDDDEIDIINDVKAETLNVPPSAEIEFESIDFDFILDPEDFENISNEVVRFDSVSDPKLPGAIAILESCSTVGFTCLPWAEDRDTPIDFAIFGCDKGTFIFPIIPGMMSKLKAILESKDICKVMHDCSFLAARLHILYKIDLTNVDDTLVVDSVVVKSKSGKDQKRSYSVCLEDYLQIDLPWADKENFYEKCGKGKLLSKPLDETGASYARSLVMLLCELRTEVLKHYYYPLLAKQESYLNNAKYMSSQTYAALRQDGCFSPFYLGVGEIANVEEMNWSNTSFSFNILSKKYKFFNRVRSKNDCKSTKSVYVQCQLSTECTQTEKKPEASRIFGPCPNGKLGEQKSKIYNTRNDSAFSSDEISENSVNISQPNSSRSSQLSSTSSSLSQSPEISHNKSSIRESHVFNGNNSSAMNVSHGLVHKNDNHVDSPLNQPASHDKLTNEYRRYQTRLPRLKKNHTKDSSTDGSIDWVAIAQNAEDRPGAIKLLPAGANY